jgi:hypothetical protein
MRDIRADAEVFQSLQQDLAPGLRLSDLNLRLREGSFEQSKWGQNELFDILQGRRVLIDPTGRRYHNRRQGDLPLPRPYQPLFS